MNQADMDYINSREYWNEQKENGFRKIDKMNEAQARYCLKTLVEFFCDEESAEYIKELTAKFLVQEKIIDAN